MESAVVKSRDPQVGLKIDTFATLVRVALARSAIEETLITKRNVVRAIKRLDIRGYCGSPVCDDRGSTPRAAGLAMVVVSIFAGWYWSGGCVTLRVAMRRWRKSPCSG